MDTRIAAAQDDKKSASSLCGISPAHAGQMTHPKLPDDEKEYAGTRIWLCKFAYSIGLRLALQISSKVRQTATFVHFSDREQA